MSKKYRILVFYFTKEPPLKWKKIILAAKIILFHFRRGSMLKENSLIASRHAAAGRRRQTTRKFPRVSRRLRN